MSQYPSMTLSQGMKMEQRLTAQMIQCAEILQLPLQALEARVREEMEKNPVLEELEREAPEEVTPTEAPPATEANQAEAEGFERLEDMGRALEIDPGDLPYGRVSSGSGDRDSKMDAMANTASRSENLFERLTQQWGVIEASPKVAAAGEAIIEWMDEDGYLRTEAEHHPRGANNDQGEATPLVIKRSPEDARALLEQIAHSRMPPLDLEAMPDALALVQSLEPTGVGARDLTECLLIQLNAEHNDDPLVYELVENHLEALVQGRLSEVAKATGHDTEEIRAALKIIGKLHHHPGLLVRPVDVPRVNPDILVDYAEDFDGYTVRLARGNNPRLGISAHYRSMWQDRTQDKEAREFIKKRIEAATALIDAIQFRRDRLLEVGKIIVDRQREFFDYGPQFLKVLRMRDVAEQLHCDPSTISRTVDEKYLQSPRGIYPLRIFFTGGTEQADGESVSWDAVKAQVKEIIDAEDKSKPLRDDEISELIGQRGVKLSRRTVAKYRSQLDIPAYQQRKG